MGVQKAALLLLPTSVAINSWTGLGWTTPFYVHNLRVIKHTVHTADIDFPDTVRLQYSNNTVNFGCLRRSQFPFSLCLSDRLSSYYCFKSDSWSSVTHSQWIRSRFLLWLTLSFTEILWVRFLMCVAKLRDTLYKEQTLKTRINRLVLQSLHEIYLFYGNMSKMIKSSSWGFDTKIDLNLL